MKVLLHSWRALILAWAVVLAPQAALVHALSHDAAAAVAQRDETDPLGHGASQACGTCLAFAQLGASLPSRFESAEPVHAPPRIAGTPAIAAIPRHLAAFHARAPPVA